MLHDPVYLYDYANDLLREFPRLPLYHEFDIWARMGRELLDLHLGFESAEPYPAGARREVAAASAFPYQGDGRPYPLRRRRACRAHPLSLDGRGLG